MNISELKIELQKKYGELLELYSLPISSMVFEERVKQKCFHCKNYNHKWTCPPKTNHINYKKLFSEYDNCAVVICAMYVDDKSLEDVRSKSTNLVHRALLYLENVLYDNNEPMAISFIGGSCKLCKNGCNPSRCVNPYLSRSPWESTGCNVIKTLDSIGIKVTFPITNKIFRYGIILW